MSTDTVYAKLIAAVRTKQTKFKLQYPKEPDQKFLLRVLEVLADIEDAAFDAMGKAAQDWFNDAATAANSKNDITLPEGFASNQTDDGEAAEDRGDPDAGDDQPDADDEGGGQTEAEAPAAPAAKGKGKAAPKKDAKAAPAKAAKKPAEKKARKPAAEKDRSKSLTYQIRLAVAKDKDVTADTIKASLLEMGFDKAKIKDVTIAACMYDARRMMEAMEEAGWTAP